MMSAFWSASHPGWARKSARSVTQIATAAAMIAAAAMAVSRLPLPGRGVARPIGRRLML